MNQNAKKWVEALRSGDYPQTTGSLRNKDGYCCLGVACEISREELGLDVTDFNMEHDVYYNDEPFVLCKEVQSWLGLKSCEGEMRNTEGTENTLSGLNDLGWTFNQIADIIESEPEGLFE